MNYEDDTTVCVTFKDTTHNLGVIDLDRFSKVSLINKVLVRVYGRMMKFDELFRLTVWVPWESKDAEIFNDEDLFFPVKRAPQDATLQNAILSLPTTIIKRIINKKSLIPTFKHFKTKHITTYYPRHSKSQ